MVTKSKWILFSDFKKPSHCCKLMFNDNTVVEASFDATFDTLHKKLEEPDQFGNWYKKLTNDEYENIKSILYPIPYKTPTRKQDE